MIWKIESKDKRKMNEMETLTHTVSELLLDDNFKDSRRLLTAKTVLHLGGNLLCASVITSRFLILALDFCDFVSERSKRERLLGGS